MAKFTSLVDLQLAYCEVVCEVAWHAMPMQKAMRLWHVMSSLLCN